MHANLGIMNWNRILRIIAIAVCAFMPVTGEAVAEQARTWTSADGKFTVEAELVEVDDLVVRLRRSDGQVISVPLANISDSDRDYLRKQREPVPRDMRHVWLPQHPARLVELTAQLRTTNSSTTAVSKFVFRVTTPPNALEHQRSVFVSSDIQPAERRTHKTGANEYLVFHLRIGILISQA